MLNVHGIRRNVKNVVRNYSDAQIKVREATSNDPWGPSGTLMSEIADLTYNVVAFSEIMQVIWKRLNDHGKNWKHVYKALVLLEYLIKTGSEKVTQQCRENIFAIQTLKDFQHIEDNKDHGMNVREKAKQLVSLLKDDERLKNERARALKARERFAQATSHVGSETAGRLGSSSYHDSHNSLDEAASPRELENARPQTAGEEELQLQLALAMSKEEAEQEERIRRNDDLRLQMAITESQEDFKRAQEKPLENGSGSQKSALDDLLGIGARHGSPSQPNLPQASATDPWGVSLGPEEEASDDWQSPLSNQAGKIDPWNVPTSAVSSDAISNASGGGLTPKSGGGAGGDPWNSMTSGAVANDPWSPKPLQSGYATNGGMDEFDGLSRKHSANSPDLCGPRANSPNPFDMSGLKKSLSADSNLHSKSPRDQHGRKLPESFLGANSDLVNLDALVNSKTPGYAAASAVAAAATVGDTNPFSPASYNPFQAVKPPPPTINQLRAQSQFPAFSATAAAASTEPPAPPVPSSSLPTPLVPMSGTAQITKPASPPISNPFL